MNEEKPDSEKPVESKQQPIGRVRKFFAELGPGVTTGAADDDPSGIAAGVAFALARFTA